jgi:hypothetical protein
VWYAKGLEMTDRPAVSPKYFHFHQPANLPDAEYHDRFNTMVSILDSVSLTLSHQPDLLNYVSQDLYGKDFDDLTNVAAIEKVIKDNQEQFLAYCMIRFSNPSHTGLHDSLHNEDYIQESKRYPKKRSAALLLLEQTTKTPTVSSVSEGLSFAQKGGNAAKKSKPNDNKWANKECTHCGKKGHNPDNCFKKKSDKESKESSKSSEPKDSKSKSSNDRDDISVLSGISKQDLLKTFTMVAQQEQLKEELSDSEDDVAPSHFQHNFVTREAVTMDYMFKQSTTTDLDLRKVILLDSQSTLDVFCNRNLLKNIRRAPEPI